ncbi:iron-chelator esterase [Bacillus subtilis]|nr:iron-chelator esterase [Bacillus subtilis]
MFAILKYPSMFGKIGSISGSYWYENAAETIHISSLKPGTARVFMSIGSEEGREKQSIQRHMLLKKTKQVHQSLKRKGFTEDQLCLSLKKERCTTTSISANSSSTRSNGYTEKTAQPYERFFYAFCNIGFNSNDSAYSQTKQPISAETACRSQQERQPETGRT